jgi:hypothetical protein
LRFTLSKYLAILLFGLTALRAEVQFSGFCITPKQSLYALTDTEAGVSSGWLKVGQSFHGTTVVSFDADRDVLVVRQGDKQTELRLREAKVKAGKSVITGTVSLAGNEHVSVRATLFVGEEAVFPLKDNVTLKLKPEVQADGNISYEGRFVMRGADGNEKVVAVPTVLVRPNEPFAIQVGDYGYSFKP